MDNEDQLCVNCCKTFSKKGKNYNRTGLFSKIRNRKCQSTPADILQDKFMLSVTPNRKSFICTDCEKVLFAVSENDSSALQKFHSLRKRGSYVSSKLKSPSRSPTASPLSKKPKIQSRPSTSHCSSRLSFEPKLDLPNSKTGKAISLLLRRSYKSGLKQLINSSKSMKRGFMSVAADLIREESVKLSQSNIFDTFESMQDLQMFSLERVIQKIRTVCPLLYEVVVASITSKKSSSDVIQKRRRKTISLKPVVASLISQIAFIRNKKCNIFQAANATSLWYAGCHRKVHK